MQELTNIVSLAGNSFLSYDKLELITPTNFEASDSLENKLVLTIDFLAQQDNVTILDAGKVSTMQGAILLDSCDGRSQMDV